MARIPDEEIERLKSEISLERLAESAGVALKRHGSDLIGLCPFHDDHEPSLVITPSKNLWHCLGACQSGGSVIDWVMKTEGVSFRHAVEILREGRLSPLAARGRRPPKASTVRRLASPIAPSADDQALLAQVVAYYHQTLLDSPEALEYLARRGIGDQSLIEEYKIGYANRTLGYRLENKNRKAGAKARGRLAALGVLRDSGHEHFNGSVVIPVFDGDGNITEIYGRKIRDDLRKGTPLHLYLPGPHVGTFNQGGIAGCEEAILAESLIDALTFVAAGFGNTTASYGVAGFTEDVSAALRLSGARRVLIAYDADQAGDTAAGEVAKELAAAGIECYRVQFPKGMDANSYACQVSPAKQALSIAVRKATWIGAGEAPPRRAEPPPVVGPGAPAPPKAAEPAPAPMPSRPSPAPRPATDVKATEAEAGYVIAFGERRWRIRGMEKNLSHAALKLNVFVTDDENFHVDNLDLYSARARDAYCAHAGRELGVKTDAIRSELGKVLLKCEELQDLTIKAVLAPKGPVLPEMTRAERTEAMALLEDPKIIARITADFETLGIVGEETNKALAYLAAISRRLDDPLAVVIQSSSAAGKSSLQDAVLSLVPDEEKAIFTAMTGQSLFYMGEADLAHKVLAISEDRGAERAQYALKVLQSEGELKIASVSKDPETGRHTTQTYAVKGPAAIFFTTTEAEIEEELASRCIVLAVDEEREQTLAIHARQREAETLSGLAKKTRKQKVISLHQNAQRLLRSVAVVNPYATRLGFVSDKTRTRRDHAKYLSLIRVIAYLRQYQKPEKEALIDGEAVAYIEVEPADIALANTLAHEALGRSLDELSPQTRCLLGLIFQMVTAACEASGVERDGFRFTRKDVREAISWSDSQVRTHLERLVTLEYVAAHTGGRGLTYHYELLYDGGGGGGQPHLSGLIDPESLSIDGYDKDFEGQIGGIDPPLTPGPGGSEAGSRLGESPGAPGDSALSGADGEDRGSKGQEAPFRSYARAG